LNVDGHAQGSLVWVYQATIGDAVAVNGKVAPGGSWQHELTLVAHHLDDLTKNFGIDLHQADLTASWKGGLRDGNLNGRVTLDHLTAKNLPSAGDVEAKGTVDVATGDNGVTLRPVKVDLHTSNTGLPDIHFASGTVSTGADGITVQTVQVAMLGGAAVLDGKFDPKTMAGDLAARWSGLAMPNQVTHSGAIVASLRMPFAGHPAISVDLTSQGTSPSATWYAKANLAGAGQSWKSIDWTLSVPRLEYNNANPIHVTQLTAHITQRWPSIALVDLSLPSHPHLNSSGAIDLSKGDWYYWVDAGGATVARGERVPMEFTLDAWGDRDVYTLHEFTLQLADLFVWAGGYYDRRIPKPVNLDVYLTRTHEITPTAVIEGHVNGSFHVVGNLLEADESYFHPQLQITGQLKSSDLVLLDRPVGDVAVELTGDVENFRTRLHTQQLVLFGGQWDLNAEFPTKKRTLELKADVHDLPLEEVARFAKVQGVQGRLASASWTFEIPSANIGDVWMDSNYDLRDASVDGLKIDQMTATARLENGLLKVDPVRASSGDGRFDGRASMDLTAGQTIQTQMRLTRWPFGTPGGAMLSMSADSKLDFDLGHLGATGPLGATVDVQLQNSPLAHVQLLSNLHQRVVSIQKINGNVLTGTFDGTADFDLDRPLEAQGQLRWYDVDAATFTSIWPALDGLGGKYSGTITIAPARDPRPIEPVRIDMNVSVEGGHYRTVEIGDHKLVAIHAVAYANTDRAVLDHSDIDMAGGMVHVWARLGHNLASQSALIDLDNLQLDQLMHIDPSQKKPVPGIVNGQLGLVGSAANLSRLLGKGHLDLTQSDLGNVGPVAALYNLMHIGSSSKPNGSGSLDLSFEQSTVRIDNFRYYNRGVDARGIMTVGPSIWDLPNALLGGQMAGTLQPLKGSRLPLLADADEIFGALQGNLSTLTISGTVSHPSYVPSSVQELTSSLRELIVGDAKASSP
jgi:hypothetical protein